MEGCARNRETRGGSDPLLENRTESKKMKVPVAFGVVGLCGTPVVPLVWDDS